MVSFIVIKCKIGSYAVECLSFKQVFIYHFRKGSHSAKDLSLKECYPTKLKSLTAIQ